MAVDLAAARAAEADSEASAAVISAAAERTAIGSGIARGGYNLDQLLSDLVQRLKTAFGEQLISVILYGSAAVGDWQQKKSDLNVLCVLDRITPAELAKSEPVFRWWREKRQPAPLLLTTEEVRASTDCFAMEFHDMQQHRRVLHGNDVILGLTVEDRFYRAQVEHELRGKQIRLRQKAAELLPDHKRLVTLLTDSISTFCVLGRHALVLSGREARWKKQEILAALEGLLGIPFKNCTTILAIRQSGESLSSGDAVSLLDGYLKETDALVRFVDGLAIP
ncbi:MAG TPA: hypothetical protein VGG97_07600 [Bryobacteraceae bacterium]